MISLKMVISAILFLSFTVFILFFGRLPAFRNNPIGKLNRLLILHLPNGLVALDRRFAGGRLLLSCSRGAEFLLNERHPTVLVLFILLMLVPELMYIPKVWPTVNTFTQLQMIVIMATPYVFLYLSASRDPGSIRSRNLIDAQSLYPPDMILYQHPPRECGTCKFSKPARSKHCSLCKSCVSRADHHCIFINNCVGYNNIHHFMLLLLSTSILVSAGVYLGIDYLNSVIAAAHPGFGLWGTGLDWSQYADFLSHVLVVWTRVAAITLLCILMAPLVWALTCYQFYLIWAGVTTNETSKWGDLALDIRDGFVFKRSLITSLPSQFGNERVVGGGSRWRREAKEIVVRTIDKKAPTGSRADRLKGEGEWVAVKRLGELDNIYDVGFLANLKDVFLPRRK